MESIRLFMDPNYYQLLTSKVRLRPGARSGIWCSWIFPTVLILSLIKYCTIVTIGYRMATLSSILSAIYLNSTLFNHKPLATHTLALSVAISYCIVVDMNSIGIVRVISISILITMKSYLFLFTLLKNFPKCFSIGEATLIIEGAISFITCTVTNCLLNKSHECVILSQVVLLGIGLTLLIASAIKYFQHELLPFIALLLAVMGIFTLPMIYFTLEKNPITLILSLIYLVFSTENKGVILILIWTLCAVIALLFAWFFGPGRKIHIKVTMVRKFFHFVAISIFLPGVCWSPILLFAASVSALAGFFVLEAIRLYNLGAFGAILNSSMSGFLDEKDNGHLILSHTYLLVGCSLPIWILPVTNAENPQEILILCSGLISLGVGDSAASIGGSIFGRTKWNGSDKSLEGTACFIAAEIIFIFFLQALGVFDFEQPSPFPWLSYMMASLVTSLIEAHTTQVDNLVLPLVMYIVLLI